MGNNSVAVGNDINYDYLLWHEQIMIGTRILAQCFHPLEVWFLLGRRLSSPRLYWRCQGNSAEHNIRRRTISMLKVPCTFSTPNLNTLLTTTLISKDFHWPNCCPWRSCLLRILCSAIFRWHLIPPRSKTCCSRDPDSCYELQREGSLRSRQGSSPAQICYFVILTMPRVSCVTFSLSANWESKHGFISIYQ